MDNEVEEELRKENEAKNAYTPKKIDRGAVNRARFQWIAGVIVFDLATGWAIWQLSRWWYAAMWVAAGAGGLLFSEDRWERVGNNTDQKNIADWGIKVSGGSIFLMGLVSGVLYVMGMVSNDYASAAVVAAVLILFAYHVLQAYRYHVLDDKYIDENERALADAEAQKEIERYNRAAYKATKKGEALQVKHNHQKTHGGAFDEALKGIDKRPMQALAKDTEGQKLESVNPPTPRRNP
jgi:hypothetical protein